MVRSLGADTVIDYTKKDFTQPGTEFDLIFDAVGKTSKSVCRRLLKPDGKFITVMTNPKSNPDDLIVLKELIESGKLKTVIDRVYTLEQIREAHAYVEKFHKKGNVVVNIVKT
jgi:NADPH:quinone reductase-like Zn-dependent oxidoreductase